MNKKWIISITATLIIWGAGIGSYFYIGKSVPNELQQASSAIVAESPKKQDTKVPQKERNLKEVIYEVQKSVVMIEVADTGASGSGFLYNNKGDVLTNAHVVSGIKDVKVKLTDARELEGKVIGVSTDTDIAVVRVPALEGTEPLKLDRNNHAELGDKVLALGSPLGLQNTVTSGIISGVDRDFDLMPYKYEDVYQISAPIAPGNSGGPLVREGTGEVIGINSAGMSEGNIGFSIPIIDVLKLVEGWSENPMTSLPEAEVTESNSTESQDISLEETATYLVTYFYESLGYEDYVTAYSLLGSNWQSNTSYEEFRNGYMDTLSVTLDDVKTTQSGKNITAIGIISAEERTEDGGERYRKYKVTYTIGYENSEVKLLSGKGEIVE